MKVDANRAAINALGVQTAERFDRVDRRFEQVDACFEQIDARFEQVDRRFDQVDRGFAEMRGRLDQTAAGQQQIADMLTTLHPDPVGSRAVPAITRRAPAQSRVTVASIRP